MCSETWYYQRILLPLVCILIDVCRSIKVRVPDLNSLLLMFRLTAIVNCQSNGGLIKYKPPFCARSCYLEGCVCRVEYRCDYLAKVSGIPYMLCVSSKTFTISHYQQTTLICPPRSKEYNGLWTEDTSSTPWQCTGHTTTPGNAPNQDHSHREGMFRIWFYNSQRFAHSALPHQKRDSPWEVNKERGWVFGHLLPLIRVPVIRSRIHTLLFISFY